MLVELLLLELLLDLEKKPSLSPLRLVDEPFFEPDSNGADVLR